MAVDRIRIDRCTTPVGAAPAKPRAHTTGKLANGRGVPGADDHTLEQPAGLVKSAPPLGGQPNLEVLINSSRVPEQTSARDEPNSEM